MPARATPPPLSATATHAFGSGTASVSATLMQTSASANGNGGRGIVHLQLNLLNDPVEAGVAGNFHYSATTDGPNHGGSVQIVGLGTVAFDRDPDTGGPTSGAGTMPFVFGMTSEITVVASAGGVSVGAASVEYEVVLFEDRKHWSLAGGGNLGEVENWLEEQVPGATQYQVFNNPAARTLGVSLDMARVMRGLIVDGETVDLNLGGHELDLGTAGLSLKEYSILLGEGRDGTSRLTVRNGSVKASNGIFIGHDLRPSAGTPVKGELIVEAGGVVDTASLVSVAGPAGTEGSVTVRNGGILETERLEVGKSLVAKGTVLVRDVGSILRQRGATSSIGLNGEGEVTVQGGGRAEWDATLVDIGSATNHHSVLRIEGPGTTSSGGSFGVGNGALFEVRDKAVLDSAAGEVFARAGGTFRLQDATATLDTLTLEGGVATMEAGSVATVGFVTVNAGLLRVTGTGTSLTGIDELNVTGGTFELSQGARASGNTVNILAGARLGGSGGTLAFTNVISDGFLSPGNSPGTLTIEGNFLQSDGALQLEIGGLMPGTEHDVLIVTGDLTITGGVIELAFIDGFAPLLGETFTLLDVGGTFASSAPIMVTGLEDGWLYSTSFSPTEGTLTLVSQSNGVFAAPEPSGTLLLLLGGAFFGRARHRRR